MGQAKRRRENRERHKLQDAANQMFVEGQGVWNIDIVHRRNVPGMILNSPKGEIPAIVVMITQALAAMRKLQSPAMCLLCDHQFVENSPEALVFFGPAIDVPTQVITNGVCAACTHPEHDLAYRVAAKYRDTMLEDMRIIPMPVGSGQA